MVKNNVNIPGASATLGANAPAVTATGSNAGGGFAGGGTVSSGGILSRVFPVAAAKPDGSKFRIVVEKIDSAILKLIPDGSSISLGGQSLTKAQILGELQPTLDLFSAVDAQVKAIQKARLDLAAALPATHQFVKSLEAAIVNALGPGNPELDSFGIKTGKKRPLTAEQKFLREQKAAKTRLIRGTLGKRQKQDVKFKGELQAQSVESTGTQSGGGNATPVTATGGGNATGDGSATPTAK